MNNCTSQCYLIRKIINGEYVYFKPNGDIFGIINSSVSDDYALHEYDESIRKGKQMSLDVFRKLCSK